MRIISGKLKGKSIFFLKNEKTRPLKDSLKENIFNILSHSNLIDIEIKNSNILDLYSGIGSFGLECISREARQVTFIEEDINALKTIWTFKKPYEAFEPLITFNCQKDANPFDTNLESKIHAHLFIESKALFAVLTGISHWNNFEVGSVFQVRRVPDIFNREMQSYLNFLSII